MLLVELERFRSNHDCRKWSGGCSAMFHPRRWNCCGCAPIPILGNIRTRYQRNETVPAACAASSAAANDAGTATLLMCTVAAPWVSS